MTLGGYVLPARAQGTTDGTPGRYLVERVRCKVSGVPALSPLCRFHPHPNTRTPVYTVSQCRHRAPDSSLAVEPSFQLRGLCAAAVAGGRWPGSRSLRPFALPSAAATWRAVQVCAAEQAVQPVCEGCGVEFSEYFCKPCKLFGSHGKAGIFHCEGCGICRVGAS